MEQILRPERMREDIWGQWLDEDSTREPDKVEGGILGRENRSSVDGVVVQGRDVGMGGHGAEPEMGG